MVGFQSLPKVALAPLIVIWFGFGLEGKVFVTAVITFFPVLVGAMGGYNESSLSASNSPLVQRRRMAPVHEDHPPSSLPFLFAGLNVASVLAMLGAVVGEFVGRPCRAWHASHAIRPGPWKSRRCSRYCCCSAVIGFL